MVDNVDLEIVLELENYPLENQREIFYHLFAKLREQPWARNIIQEVSEKLSQKSKELYEFETQRNYFLV